MVNSIDASVYRHYQAWVQDNIPDLGGIPTGAPDQISMPVLSGSPQYNYFIFESANILSNFYKSLEKV